MTTETISSEPTVPVVVAPAQAPTDDGRYVELKEALDAMRAELAKLAETKASPVVPSTETPKPAITPIAPDPASLPVYARMAAGYSK